MIDKSKTNERAEFLGDENSADAIRKRFIEAPTEAAQQPAIKIGLELLAFMSALPEAFLASEQRELKRLAQTSNDKNDLRIERLKVSIERASELHATSLQGKARIDRAVASLSEDGDIFHGFVSDSELQPREKLTVRISASRDGGKDGKSLSATTDADGYFSISLGDKKTGSYTPNPRESTVKLSEQMAERLASVNAKAKAKTAAGTSGTYTPSDNSQEALARVEILDVSGKVLHQDSSPLVINSGTAYREYVVDGDDSIKSYEHAASGDAVTSTAPNAPVSARKKATAAKKPVSGKAKK
jgi:hypothetical protein